MDNYSLEVLKSFESMEERERLVDLDYKDLWIDYYLKLKTLKSDIEFLLRDRVKLILRF
jgi:hypothetical protein